MSVFKLSARQYPNLSMLKPGDSVSFQMKARVTNRIMTGTDDTIEVSIDDLGYQAPEVRVHPAEIMKQIADMQGMINTPQG